MTLLNGHEPHELAPDRTGRRWGITVAEANNRLRRAAKAGPTMAEAEAELRATFNTGRAPSSFPLNPARPRSELNRLRDEMARPYGDDTLRTRPFDRTRYTIRRTLRTLRRRLRRHHT